VEKLSSGGCVEKRGRITPERRDRNMKKGGHCEHSKGDSQQGNEEEKKRGARARQLTRGTKNTSGEGKKGQWENLVAADALSTTLRAEEKGKEIENGAERATPARKGLPTF